MTHENLTDALARIHTATTRVLTSNSHGLKQEVFESLEDAEEELDAIRTWLAQSPLETFTTATA